MKIKIYITTRKITVKECAWLDDDIDENTIVYKYYGATYGCISPTGIAVTEEPNKTPFFELPIDALVLLEEREAAYIYYK